MKIIEYRFGHLSTETEHFTRDVVLGPENVYPYWWRKEGHTLNWEDLREFVEREQPDVVVIGRGKFGMVSVRNEVRRQLAERGIELLAERTDKAVRIFNELQEKRKVLGAFHLTC